MTASFGVASYASGDDLDSVVARADLALYEAKHNGRNGVECGMPQSGVARLAGARR